MRGEKKEKRSFLVLFLKTSFSVRELADMCECVRGLFR